MLRAIKERTVIQPGGILKIQRSDLPEGVQVEVVVLVEEPPEREDSVPPLTSFIGAGKGVYGATPEEADAYLENERASWDE